MVYSPFGSAPLPTYTVVAGVNNPVSGQAGRCFSADAVVHTGSHEAYHQLVVYCRPSKRLSTFVVTDVLGQLVQRARSSSSPFPGGSDHTGVGNKTS